MPSTHNLHLLLLQKKIHIVLSIKAVWYKSLSGGKAHFLVTSVAHTARQITQTISVNATGYKNRYTG